eukprot:TRINITY_DN3709_c0_g2_i2.p1 TRINITY_DN3709_c0_g2~~TRINITY_DN3709_c0_g2_i2.p1  ORF type:complete len:401 (-),score=50.60 TRINITY_DN3709_c0_g2_i2:616-1722(-)
MASGDVLNYVGFNVTKSCICVGTLSGFLIFKTHPFDLLHRVVIGACTTVQYIEDINLVIVSGHGFPGVSEFDTCMVKFYQMNLEDNQEIHSLTFSEPVLNIVSSSKRVAIITESEIHLFKLNGLILQTSIVTEPNPRGICSISEGNESFPPFLVYASTMQSKGAINVFDPVSLNITKIMQFVHEHPLTNICFSLDSQYIATASEQGTLIKIINVMDENDRFSFRRGIQKGDIVDITFNNDSTLLAASSLSGTVHIFRVSDHREILTSSGNGILSMIPGSSFLIPPEPRSFTTVKLEDSYKNMVAFSDDSSQIITVSSDGRYCLWELADRKENGWTKPECKLLREINLTNEYYIAMEMEGTNLLPPLKV